MAMLSILALYNWDENIFDGMDVPEGMSKVTTVENILLECAELPLVYTEPNFMKKAIKQWSDKEQNVWQKLYDTENFEYNPIWNVDADITENESTERDKSGSIGRTRTEYELGTSESTLYSTDTQDTTDTKSVTGYNSANWQAHEKDVIDTDGSVSSVSNGNTSRQLTGSDSVEDEEGETVGRELTTRRTGNIGVTTTQQMIQQEREVATFNTIDYITQSFKRRFCVMIY